MSENTTGSGSGNSRGLAGSAAVMFAGTLTSRLLGLVRSALLIAALYSLGGAADAFAVANKIPNIVYMLIAGGVLNAVLVPQIVRAMRNDDGGQEYVNRLLTLAGTVLAVVTVILTAAAPILVTMYAAEFRSGPWASVAIAFAMWCLPQLFFYGMYTLLGQVLNARSVFGPYMWAPAVNNLFAIIGLIIYLVIFGTFDPANPDPPEAYTAGRVALLAGTATLGVAAQAAVLVVPLVRSGFKFRFRWGVRGSGLGRAGRVAWWAFLALLAGQVGYLAISNISAAASTAAEQAGTYAAGNAAWDNAFLVFMLPQSLITVSLVTALFTRLSANAAAGRRDEVRNDLSAGLRTLGVFTVFAAGALAVLAIPVVQVVQFDQADFEAYQAVGAVLVALVIALPAIAIWTMTQRVYFAFEDTKALFYFQVPMALIQILGSLLAYLLLPAQWWVVGAACANSLSLMFGAVISFLALRRKLYRLDGARILRTYVRLTLAILLPSGVAWGLLSLWGADTNFAGAVLRVLVLGALMALLYFIFLRRLRVSELDELLIRIGGLAAPLTTRLAPLVARIPGMPQVRTIWGRITGVEHRRASPMDMPPALNRGDVLAGRYRLVHQDADPDLWLGVDTILERQVQIRTVTGPRREATLDAARRAALVTDDRLLRILRVGSHESVGFIVTDVVSGQSLVEVIAAGQVHPDQARTLVGEAAGALEVARRRGVHHLRLRPESLIRTSSGGVLITGLAVDAAAAGVAADNPRAAARGDTVDLVGLLYAALTGHYPGEPDLAGPLPPAPHLADQPVPPAELASDIPEDLDTLCAVTFGPHRDGPFTPGELVRDLAPWADPGEGPVHRGPSASPTPGTSEQADGTPDDDATGPGAGGTAAAGIAGAAAAGMVGVSSGDAAGAGAGTTAAGVAHVQGAGPPGERTGGAKQAAAPASTERPLDTTGWSPKPPPQVSERPDFDSLIRPDKSQPAAHVLDTYAPRHEQLTFDPQLETPQSAPASGEVASWQQPRGSGATALRRPGEPPVDLPPTAEPPPGVIPEYDQPTGAEADGDAADPSVAAGAGAGAGTGAAGSGAGAKAAGGLAAAGAGIASGLGSAGAAVSSAARRAGAGLRNAGSRMPEWTTRAGESVRELTSSWRSPTGEPDEQDSGARTTAFASVSTDTRAPTETQESQAPADYPEYVAHPTASTGMEPPDDPDDDVWEDDDEPERFNPTPVVILTMIAAVVVAGLLAFGSLRDARTSFDPDSINTPTPTVAPPEEEPEEEEEEEPEEEPEEEEEEEDQPEPEIGEARSLDDNPDLAYLVLDGNPETIWRSLRYNDPNYGMKEGLGFVVELEETAVVNSVTLDVQGEGGTVQIRADDPENPESGPVLAEGSMGPEVTYELAEPTETDVVVLWFPELPVADSDGLNRIELAGVSVR